MIEIPLSPGKWGSGIALVSDEDEDLCKHGWRIHKQIQVGGNVSFYVVQQGVGQPRMHRIIADRVIGSYVPSGKFVTHVDGNFLNCQRENLQVGRSSHLKARAADTLRGPGGACWNKETRMWDAVITHNGVTRVLSSWPRQWQAKKVWIDERNRIIKEYVGNHRIDKLPIETLLSPLFCSSEPLWDGETLQWYIIVTDHGEEMRVNCDDYNEAMDEIEKINLLAGNGDT